MTFISFDDLELFTINGCGKHACSMYYLNTNCMTDGDEILKLFNKECKQEAHVPHCSPVQQFIAAK